MDARLLDKYLPARATARSVQLDFWTYPLLVFCVALGVSIGWLLEGDLSHDRLFLWLFILSQNGKLYSDLRCISLAIGLDFLWQFILWIYISLFLWLVSSSLLLRL